MKSIKHFILSLLNKQISGKGFYSFRDLYSPTPLMKPFPYSIEESDFSYNIEKSDFKKVIYIVSPTQRSGTNYCALLFSLHKNLELPNKSFIPNEQFLFSFSDIINSYLREMIGYWGYWIKNDKLRITHHKRFLGFIGNGILQYLYEYINSGSTMLLRTPDSLGLENFPYLFPNGKVILIIRDGRDVVNSFVKSFSGNWAFKKMTRRWSYRVKSILKILESESSQNYIKVIKYEDLLEDPQKVIISTLKYLELDEYNFRWDEINNIPVVGSSSVEQTDRGFWEPTKRTSSFMPKDNWKKWSSRKKRLFRKVAGEELIKLGYESNNEWC